MAFLVRVGDGMSHFESTLKIKLGSIIDIKYGIGNCLFGLSSLLSMYRAITSAYYRGDVGALLVYHVTRNSTVQNVERWSRDHKDPNIAVIIVGNEAGLRHLIAVSTEDGKSFAEGELLFFMETSALEASNVDSTFAEVLTQIYHIGSKKALEAIENANGSAFPSKGEKVDMSKDVSDMKKRWVLPDPGVFLSV